MNKSGLKHANKEAALAEPVRQTEQEHIDIDQQTREFLARGGKIKKLGTYIRSVDDLKKGWAHRQ